NAGRHAAPSGAAKTPTAAPISPTAATSSASLTAIAVPPDARIASRMRKSPIAFGTLNPDATVDAFSNSSANRSPFSKALTIGAHVEDWTDTIFGRFGPIQPI